MGTQEPGRCGLAGTAGARRVGQHFTAEPGVRGHFLEGLRVKTLRCVVTRLGLRPSTQPELENCLEADSCPARQGE